MNERAERIINNLEIIEDIITRDSLSNRDIKWLNVILRKVM